MMKTIFATLLATCAAGAAAHDMFLKPTSFYVAPDSAIVVDLLTGTFDKSENPVTRDRMADTSVLTGGKMTKPAASQWSDSAKASHLRLTTGAPGTYAIGLSSKPSIIKLSAADFENYLRHDGIDDIIVERSREGASKAEVAERYSKHVRAVVQVGSTLTDDASRPLGYPAELLLLDNPATLKPGATLRFRALYQGKPLGGQLVYGSSEDFHGHDANGGHITKLKMRTAADGSGTLKIDRTGKWYLTFINMHKVNEPGVTYESNWATVTFEVR